MPMTAEEIRAALEQGHAMPDGRAKAQLLETLAERARENGGAALEAEVLINLCHAYEYAAEREKLPVVFGRLLPLLDQHPAEVEGLSHTIHWMLKWMTFGLYDNPAVPMPVINRWLDELESRYRQHGYSPRPVLALRSRVARHLGDSEVAAALMEQSIAAPRDRMTDCEACEHGDWGDSRVDVGDDAGALEHWAPVLGGGLSCKEEPHRVLAKTLLPLLRLGRADEARGAFLRGYPLVAHNVSLMYYLAYHLEFCALTGNEARGLEILAEHAGWLTDMQADVGTQLDLSVGMAILLRRLTVLGHGALPVGTGTVDSHLSALEPRIAELSASYDARNGNTAVSDRVARRLTTRPLLDFLPLGLAPRLPATPPADTVLADTVLADTVPADTVPADTLGDRSRTGLVAQARRLTQARHPGAQRAWARVRAMGDLPADVAAEAERARAGDVMRADPAAAVPLLADVAGRFATLGDTDRELEALASAAVAAGLADVPQAAPPDIADVISRAEEAFAGGGLSARYYLNVLLDGQLIPAHALETTQDRDPARIAAVAAGLETVRALAERLGERFHLGRCHDLLARMSAMRDDDDGMTAHLRAAREAFLAQDQPWFAAYPEATLAEHALRRGDLVAAEQLARSALAHGLEFAARQRAYVSSLLVGALDGQQGREADLADVALAAAARWDGVSEPAALHSTVTAARAYAALDRHGEAAALFAQAISKVDDLYSRPEAAMTRDQYGRSLGAIGQHEAAAEQFLLALGLLEGDQGNARPYAVLAALAAEELQHSGQFEAARPAFLKAADLMGALGAVGGRARCLRAAAWLEFDAEFNSAEGNAAETDPASRPSVARMRALLTELEGQPQTQEIAAETDQTREQLAAMLGDE
jgi:tetratricopeptide (TPR) repeat protein